MKWRILNAVPVDLPNVKVFLDLLDLFRNDVIGSSPDTVAVICTLLLKHEDMEQG